MEVAVHIAKAAARPPHSKFISVRGSKHRGSALDDCGLQRKRKLFWASRVRRAHMMPGRTGRLDGMLILCYIVSVGTCVQKRETPPAFFILGIPSSASARIFRGTTPSCLPDHSHRTEVMRSCLPAEAGAA